MLISMVLINWLLNGVQRGYFPPLSQNQYIVILRIFKFHVFTIYTFGTSAGSSRGSVCPIEWSPRSNSPLKFVPTLPVFTHRLYTMPTHSGRFYSIEAGSMNHVRESPEEREIEEGEIERRPTKTKGFWEVIKKL